MSPDSPKMGSVAALVVVHNRWDLTRHVLEQLIVSGVAQSHIVVVDDGSTDGTPVGLATEFPEAVVIRADGSLYWGGAMHVAEARAVTLGVSHLLWINNDLELDPGALQIAVAATERHPSAILVGAVRAPDDGSLTYSGYRQTSRLHGGLRMTRVTPHQSDCRAIDTFNGNFVLVPLSVADLLGGVDVRLRHHYGDFDYGLRATRAGVACLLLPGTVGTTARNSSAGSFRDASLPRRRRVLDLLGPKGFPPRARMVYLRRHGSPLWPAQWIGFYAVWFVRIGLGV